MNIFFYVKLNFTLIFFITTCAAQDGPAWQKKHLPDGAAAAPQKKYLSVHIPTDTSPSALITTRVSPQTSPEEQGAQPHRMSISAASSASHTNSNASSPRTSKPPSATAAIKAIFSPSEKEEYRTIIDRCNAQIAQEKEAHEKEKAVLTKQNQELQAELAHLKLSIQQRQRSHSRSSIPPRHSRTSSLSASSSASSPSAEPGTPFIDLPGRNSPERDSPPPSPEEQIPFSQQSPHFGKRTPPTTSVLAAVTEEETNEWLV